MRNLQNPAIVGMFFCRPSEDVYPCKINFGIQGVSDVISVL